MTDSVHPTPEELSDLQADLLTGADRTRVQDHVDHCADCGAELAAIDDVSAMLAEAGSETLTMPSDVSADLDEAIAAASRERAAGVPSLAARRETSREPGREGTARRTPWVLIGGAAAAAVVVLGAIGLNGMQSDDDSAAEGSSADAADAGGDTAGQSDAESPEDSQGYALPSPNLTPDSVATFASRVAGKKSSVTLRAASGCAANLPEPTDNARATAYLDVRWEGEPAVLVVDKTARTATVFGCGTGAEVLYSTSY